MKPDRLRYAIFVLGALCLLVCGCQSIFRTVAPGDHWRITLGAGDPKLTLESPSAISEVVVQRLHLTPEKLMYADNQKDVLIVGLHKDVGADYVRVILVINRSTSEITLESLYFYETWLKSRRSPDGPKIQQDMAQQVLEVLKELYPNSSAAPYIRYAPPFGF